MALLRLRTQLLVPTLLIICALTGALLFIVRTTVRSGVDRQVQDSTAASLRAFESVQSERGVELSRTAAMLAELPTLKALMTSNDPPTIQDASTPFWKLAGSDLFLLASSGGRILGFHVAKTGWSPSLIEGDLARALAHDQDPVWWYANGQLYWVFLRPIFAGSGSYREGLGFVAVGYRVDSSVASQLSMVSGSMITLAVGHNVIASTLPPAEEAAFEGWIHREDPPPGSDRRPITLDKSSYQVAAVSLPQGSPTPVLCYVLVSLQPAERFIAGLNRTILLLALSGILLAALLLEFVSRRITRPLEDLVGGVRAFASGDYTYSLMPHGSSEVAELTEAFSKMRNELLESQRRWRTAERIAALGRASSSISHDLRHYLATIVANAEFLYESDRHKDSREEIYADIKSASEQMTELLESLRELSRDGAAISPGPGALDRAIRRAIDAVRSRPELSSDSITLHISGEMDGDFDSKKIERAFFNLLLNACEACPAGPGRIEIDARSSADAFEARVSDNGPGIPLSIRNSLFDPFVSSGKSNGTGMGLAIVKKIVQDHGGSVAVETTSPSGTTFLVRLPRHRPPSNLKEVMEVPSSAARKLS